MRVDNQCIYFCISFEINMSSVDGSMIIEVIIVMTTILSPVIVK